MFKWIVLVIAIIVVFFIIMDYMSEVEKKKCYESCRNYISGVCKMFENQFNVPVYYQGVTASIGAKNSRYTNLSGLEHRDNLCYRVMISADRRIAIAIVNKWEYYSGNTIGSADIYNEHGDFVRNKFLGRTTYRFENMQWKKIAYHNRNDVIAFLLRCEMQYDFNPYTKENEYDTSFEESLASSFTDEWAANFGVYE